MPPTQRLGQLAKQLEFENQWTWNPGMKGATQSVVVGSGVLSRYISPRRSGGVTPAYDPSVYRRIPMFVRKLLFQNPSNLTSGKPMCCSRQRSFSDHRRRSRFEWPRRRCVLATRSRQCKSLNLREMALDRLTSIDHGSQSAKVLLSFSWILAKYIARSIPSMRDCPLSRHPPHCPRESRPRLTGFPPTSW